MKHKAMSGIKLDVKDASEGMVEAVFATFNVVDHDGDLTLPGAFHDGASVRISAYNHTSWGGALPVGKGIISQTDTDARMVGEFFTNTTHGRDTFETVKQLGELGQWSYGYDVLDSSHGVHDGNNVQFLKDVEVHEVSPVLLGAGIGTYTVSAKGLPRLEDLSDDECAERAREACKALLKRGIALPQDLVEAVRAADAEAESTKRRREQLATIATLHGIELEV